MADGQDAIELKRRARRRLVGAIALVVFVVIALPIVLDREPKPVSQDLTIQIPSQDAGKFSSRLLPAEVPKAAPAEIKPQAAVKTEAKAEAAPKAEAPKEKAPAPAAKPAPLETAKAEPAPAKAAAAPAAAAKADAPVKPAAAAPLAQATPKPEAKSALAAPARGFVVPLGLFSKADNIKQVRSKASAAGFTTYTETMAKGNVRVRAGPFDSRDAAEKAREKLKGAGLDVGAVASQ